MAKGKKTGGRRKGSLNRDNPLRIAAELQAGNTPAVAETVADHAYQGTLADDPQH